MFERKPPMNIEAERAVLGAILLKPAIIVDTWGLKTDDFYVEGHRLVYGAMLMLKEEGRAIDFITIADKLKDKREIVDIPYLSSLAGEAPTSANLKEYVDIVLEMSALRKLVLAGGEIVSMAYGDKGAVEAVGESKRLIDSVIPGDLEGERIEWPKIYMEIYDRYVKQGGKADFYSGIKSWDELFEMKGMPRGWVHVIAGESQMGKTTMALNIIRKPLNEGKKVLFFSREMSRSRVLERLYAMNMGKRLRYDEGRETVEALVNSMAKDWHLRIESMGLGLADMMVIAAKMRPDFIILDTLQSMIANFNGEVIRHDLKIESVVRSFERMARDYNAFVIITSQPSKELGKQKRRMTVADLRETGGIEETADSIDLLYYLPKHEMNTEFKNFLEVYRAKGREEGWGQCILKVEFAIYQISDPVYSDAEIYRRTFIDPKKD